MVVREEGRRGEEKRSTIDEDARAEIIIATSAERALISYGRRSAMDKLLSKLAPSQR